MEFTPFNSALCYVLAYQGLATSIFPGDLIVFKTLDKKTRCAIFFLRFTESGEGMLLKINNFDGIEFERFDLERFRGLVSFLALALGLVAEAYIFPNTQLHAFIFKVVPST